MFLVIIVLPLLGFLSGSLGGRYLGNKGVSIITTWCSFLTFLFSTYVLSCMITSKQIILYSFSRWIYIDGLEIDWIFYFDSLTSIMLIVVTSVSTLVHLYSVEYMEQDPHLPRFMSYLSLFTFFMLILVTAGNYLEMFVGWEGVGVSSYLLINFWYTRIQANKAAIKAMVVNRIGDLFILLALFILYQNVSSLDYEVVFSTSFLLLNNKLNILNVEFSILDFICITLFFGAMGKSAQIGLHTWLPDAMEGPTPVSALIHAATMVTAGVFLLIRCSYLFELSPIALNLIVIIGSITAVFGASVATFQVDLKKIIAYSTCSQLGYMFIACGLSGYDVAIFHLYNHAFFKALLFLSAGSIVHAMGDEQDIRRISGLYKFLPFTCTLIIIGSSTLAAFPFSSGFYSKDAILALGVSKHNSIAQFAYIMGLIGAIFTVLYSGVIARCVFDSKGARYSKNFVPHILEGSWKMFFSLFILGILSIFSGYISKELFIGVGTPFWGSSLYIIPQNYYITDIEFISSNLKLLPLISFFLLSYISINSYSYNVFVNKSFINFFFNFFQNKWNFDHFYNKFISQYLLQFSLNFSYQTVDRGLLEIIGPFGSVSLLKIIFNKIRLIQSGIIFMYLYYNILFIIFFVFLYFLVFI